jgi:hypothetical protein
MARSGRTTNRDPQGAYPASLTDADATLKLAMRQRAQGEVSATIASLVAVRDDPKANSSARVMASRAILEMAGVIGKDRPIPLRIIDKPLHEMTARELAQAAYNGERARFRLVVKDALRRGDVELALAVLDDRVAPEAFNAAFENVLANKGRPASDEPLEPDRLEERQG